MSILSRNACSNGTVWQRIDQTKPHYTCNIHDRKHASMMFYSWVKMVTSSSATANLSLVQWCHRQTKGLLWSNLHKTTYTVIYAHFRTKACVYIIKLTDIYCISFLPVTLNTLCSVPLTIYRAIDEPFWPASHCCITSILYWNRTDRQTFNSTHTTTHNAINMIKIQCTWFELV